jgi:hypothetical protein
MPQRKCINCGATITGDFSMLAHKCSAADLRSYALDEIRELIDTPPNSQVAIELIEQVFARLDDALADNALERLAMSGALDVEGESSKRKRKA